VLDLLIPANQGQGRRETSSSFNFEKQSKKYFQAETTCCDTNVGEMEEAFDHNCS